MKRKLRVSYSDPDATDSSSDEGGNGTQKKSKRMVHEIVLQPDKNLDKKSSGKNPDKKSSGKNPARIKKFKSRVLNQNRKERLIGAHRRRSGKYSAEIRDPFKKKRVWLGTYKTAEEASNAYLNKKREIKEKQRLDCVPCENSSEDSSPTVNEFGTLDSPNEVVSTVKKDAFEENKVDSTAEQNFSLSENHPVNFGMLYGVQIINNHGFLLGEFSKLDDFTIRVSE